MSTGRLISCRNPVGKSLVTAVFWPTFFEVLLVRLSPVRQFFFWALHRTLPVRAKIFYGGYAKAQAMKLVLLRRVHPQAPLLPYSTPTTCNTYTGRGRCRYIQQFIILLCVCRSYKSPLLECRKHSLHSCMILCLYYTECSIMRRIASLWEGSHCYENYYLLLYLLLKLKLIIWENLFYVILNIAIYLPSTSEPFNILPRPYDTAQR